LTLVVPIHHELIRLGFLDYHTERSKAADKRLFPRTKTNSRGQVAADFSRQWGKYLTEIGVKAGPGVNFHSFRHTFTDALRRAGFLDEQFGFILGHSKATTTGRYGILTEGQLEARVKLIDSVSYEGLDVGGNSNNASGAAS
jgi:integrase